MSDPPTKDISEMKGRYQGNKNEFHQLVGKYKDSNKGISLVWIERELRISEYAIRTLARKDDSSFRVSILTEKDGSKKYVYFFSK